ncbi:AsnC family transcriptional regulator [Pseudonocardia pini]|uniref:AsnC family transcriptional regulator n=1 Tax=Pseudonocardia pini TaxID=2758030 RepID=UPI0015EFF7C5|nr:AsnC family transcriptional regulator [Pseudonocardia pini]
MDGLDQALIAALEQDGRATNVELARSLGVSEKTVRLRITRLLTEHGLRVRAHMPVDTSASRMVFLLHTQPGRRFDVAEFLSSRPEVEHVYLATGFSDVLVHAVFADDGAALRFLVDTVESHDGVRATDSCHLIREVGGPALAPDDRHHPEVDKQVLADLMIGPQPAATLDGLLDAICVAVTNGLGADRVLVGVRSDPHARAPILRSRGLSRGYIDALAERIAQGWTPGVVRQVWDTRLHVVLPDARTDRLFEGAHDLVRAEGYVTMMNLPVLYGDSLIATISGYFDDATSLDDDYLSTAQGVADHFAVALARKIGWLPPAL